MPIVTAAASSTHRLIFAGKRGASSRRERSPTRHLSAPASDQQDPSRVRSVSGLTLRAAHGADRGAAVNGAGDVPFPTREQAGRELFAVRPWPGWGFLAVVVVTTALGYGLAYLAPERSPVLALTGAVGVLLVHLGVGGSGLLENHRVCEHALVLGPTLPGARPYVVPLSSIDPAVDPPAPSGELPRQAPRWAPRRATSGWRRTPPRRSPSPVCTASWPTTGCAAPRPWPSRRNGARCTTTSPHHRRRRHLGSRRTRSAATPARDRAGAGRRSTGRTDRTRAGRARPHTAGCA